MSAPHEDVTAALSLINGTWSLPDKTLDAAGQADACVQAALLCTWGDSIATLKATDAEKGEKLASRRPVNQRHVSSADGHAGERGHQAACIAGPLAELYDRYALLQCVVEVIETDCDAFAHIDAAETGVPLFIAKQIALGYAPAARGFLESAFSFLEAKYWEMIPGRYGMPIVRCVAPNSPAVIIAPWNVPFGTILPKLFVAWLCGCSVIVKPSEFAYRGICAVIHKLTTSGWLPPNAVQVLLGGPDIGSALTSHPLIQCVQFTGASSTAFKVAAVCARYLRPFHAECGGSNAAVVAEDADLDLAVRCIAMGMTTLNGQWCMGLTRIFIHESLTVEFLHRFTAYMNRNVEVVDPTDPTVVPKNEDNILVGRLAFVDHAKKISALCDACNPSSTLLVGAFPDRLAKSSEAFFQPRLLLDPDVNTISHQELFGPVAGLISFANVDDAIRMVNLASGQLACYVFGQHAEAMYRLAPRIRTGMVMINSVNFCFEVADGQTEPHVDFVGTAGHGGDGNGAALAAFFTSSMWVGVNGPSA